jgi:acyl-CoA thioester hydrolase
MGNPQLLSNGPYAIEPAWIDYNGHFNMAYYNVLFDRSSDEALAVVGLGPHYIKATGNSYFTLEAHITYLRELQPEDQVMISTQLLDFDTKRLHYVQLMHHAQEGWLSCVTENIVMHVDMRTKKSSPFPDAVLQKIAALHDVQRNLPVPVQVGHRIQIPKKS